MCTVSGHSNCCAYLTMKFLTKQKYIYWWFHQRFQFNLFLWWTGYHALSLEFPVKLPLLLLSLPPTSHSHILKKISGSWILFFHQPSLKGRGRLFVLDSDSESTHISLARIIGLPCVQCLIYSLTLSNGNDKAKANSKMCYLIMPFS